MGYKYGYKYPVEDRNYAIVEINHIGNDIKPNIDIYKSALDVIPYDDKDDWLIRCKCNKCKLWKLANKIK